MILFLLYLVIMNAAGYLLMHLDKKKAIKHQWRIPEFTLWAVSFLGGSMGSLIGMYRFRHKTKHLSFVLGIPALFAVHCLLILAICLKIY